MSRLALIFALSSAACAAQGYQRDSILLYQPNEVLTARLDSPETLAAYLERLDAVCTAFFAKTTAPETLHVVVAIKPGKRSRVWFVSSGALKPDGLERLRKKLETVPSIDVRGGPLAVAIAGKIAGGRPTEETQRHPPIPREWREAAGRLGRQVEIPDGVLAVVWPDEPGQKTGAAATPPAELVTQVLEPTGGKIPRPKGWFYAEAHGGPSYSWTISREDTAGGEKPYTTGVRIQLLAGVEKNTGKSPRQFVLDFVASKEKEGVKILDRCTEKEQGIFTRICLETEEGPYRILYSLFFSSSDTDLVTVSIAGTTKELWGTFAPTFDEMSAFELIDLERFGK